MKLFLKYADNVKRIPKELLSDFCFSLREYMIRSLSKTGGHLSSNLGAVELTVALHRVFDTSRDRIVFDVGHQCYTHKLLTGRLKGFKSLRSFGGLSGFPRPEESIHDAFISGHSSTSVSVALGMARARTFMGQSYRCVAVIGDGALTGGLAYEGLNDAGRSGEPLIVVLNDNGMSINKNVGGIAKHLANLRLKPRYFRTKHITKKLLDPLPGGEALKRIIRRGKKFVKDTIIPGTLFAQMGFEYLGPADGHDVLQISNLLRRAASIKKPVLIHLTTKKGKGYLPSQKNPDNYHGVAPFSLRLGKPKAAKHKTFSDVFGESLAKLAIDNDKIVAITAAMQAGCGLNLFAKTHAARFFDVGIAEGHAVTMAGAMAKQGLRPVVSIYSSFLQRAYDNIIHDVALPNLPVVFAIGNAGLCGEDGETHHGIFDLLFLDGIPNIKIFAPSSFADVCAMLKAAFLENAPVAIRFPKNGEETCPEVISEPKKPHACIVAYGAMLPTAHKAAEILKGQGKDVVVRKVSCLKPLEPVNAKGKVFLLEDNPGYLCRHIEGVPINTGLRFIPHGSQEDLLRFCGLDARAVAETIAKGL